MAGPLCCSRERWLVQNRERRIPALLLLFLVFLTFVLYNSINGTSSEYPYRVTPEVEKILVSVPFRMVATECSTFNDHCFTVVDQTTMQRKRVIIDRILLVNDLNNKAHSAVRLAIPEGITSLNLNTSAFPVDKRRVHEGYFQMMLVAPFATEALTIPSVWKQRVLVLGLGGGTLSNFLSIGSDYGIHVETTVVEIDPFMVELAKKYFGAEEKKGVTNIVTADGVDFLKKSVEKKVKYNSVMLDACYSGDELQNGQLCPVEPFFDERTIQNIYNVLNDGGTLSVNTAFEKDAGVHEDRLLEAYERVFPSCDIVSYGEIQKLE